MRLTRRYGNSELHTEYISLANLLGSRVDERSEMKYI